MQKGKFQTVALIKMKKKNQSNYNDRLNNVGYEQIFRNKYILILKQEMDKIHSLKPKKSIDKNSKYLNIDQNDKENNHNICITEKRKPKTYCISHKKQSHSKSRKDHSMEAKSPIKIPPKH